MFTKFIHSFRNNNKNIKIKNEMSNYYYTLKSNEVRSEGKSEDSERLLEVERKTSK